MYSYFLIRISKLLRRPIAYDRYLYQKYNHATYTYNVKHMSKSNILEYIESDTVVRFNSLQSLIKD